MTFDTWSEADARALVALVAGQRTAERIAALGVSASWHELMLQPYAEES